MTPHDSLTTLESRLETLDSETAQRVARLVFECSASIDLALLAVQDANRRSYVARQRDPALFASGSMHGTRTAQK